MSQLIIGCGNRRAPHPILHSIQWYMPTLFSDPVFLDIDPVCAPDVTHDLCSIPYPFPDNQFDEIHAYDVLEHTGQQGDWKFFFDQFTEFHRILKPKGHFYGVSPDISSRWAWGDPGHTRVIQPELIYFLDQNNYGEVGRTAMTDYRWYYKVSFDVLQMNIATTADKSQAQTVFLLEAVK